MSSLWLWSIDCFQIFLDSHVKLDTILNTSIGGDKDVPYAKNLPNCDFPSGGTLECEPDRCKFPVTVLHVNAQGLQSAYNELKFLLSSSPKDSVAICETFLSSFSPMSMFKVCMMKSVSCSRKLNAWGGQVICICQDWSFRIKEIR